MSLGNRFIDSFPLRKHNHPRKYGPQCDTKKSLLHSAIFHTPLINYENINKSNYISTQHYQNPWKRQRRLADLWKDTDHGVFQQLLQKENFQSQKNFYKDEDEFYMLWQNFRKNCQLEGLIYK